MYSKHHSQICSLSKIFVHHYLSLTAQPNDCLVNFAGKIKKRPGSQLTDQSVKNAVSY